MRKGVGKRQNGCERMIDTEKKDRGDMRERERERERERKQKEADRTLEY